MLKALQNGGSPAGMRAAIVSTYPPRACGIGTFAADVRASLIGLDEVESVAKVVIVDDPSRPQRPGVVATISQGTRGDYVRAARILGRRDVDVVLLEHEYGIFGGRDGEYILSLAEELTQPLVVTLHTVLSQPTRHQARVLETLCGHAERFENACLMARALGKDRVESHDERLRQLLGQRAGCIRRRRPPKMPYSCSSSTTSTSRRPRMRAART